METLYTTNAGSADVGWGTQISGALSSNIPLSFPGYRIAVMPGQRYLYITGTKLLNDVPHAFLVVLDTCSNTVTAEVDLGVGFAG